jgi:hypothetical protein
VSCLEAMKIGLMNSNRLLQLLDVLRATFSERRLSLTVTLLAFLRGCIDLLLSVTHSLLTLVRAGDVQVSDRLSVWVVLDSLDEKVPHLPPLLVSIL